MLLSSANHSVSERCLTVFALKATFLNVRWVFGVFLPSKQSNFPFSTFIWFSSVSHKSPPEWDHMQLGQAVYLVECHLEIEFVAANYCQVLHSLWLRRRIIYCHLTHSLSSSSSSSSFLSLLSKWCRFQFYFIFYLLFIDNYNYSFSGSIEMSSTCLQRIECH